MFDNIDPNKLLLDSGVNPEPGYDNVQPHAYKSHQDQTKEEREQLLLDRYFPRQILDGTTLEDLERLPSSTMASKLYVENRPDDVRRLTKPLNRYDDRVFFYAGYLNAFCRIRTSVTERFKAAANAELDSCLHPLDNPVARVENYAPFTDSQTSRLLWSVEKTEKGRAFFSYMCSNFIVVEPTLEGVKAIGLEKVKIADPFLVDQKSSIDTHEILVLVPYSYAVGLDIRPGNILSGQPFTADIKDMHDQRLKESAEEILREKGG